MILEESFHLSWQHQTFEEFKAVHDNIIFLRIVRCIRAKRPNLLAKFLNKILNVFFVFVGVEKQGLQSSSLALEHLFVIGVGQRHDLLEYVHPIHKVVLEFRMQVLIVQVVENFEKDFQSDNHFYISRVAYHTFYGVDR